MRSRVRRRSFRHHLRGEAVREHDRLGATSAAPVQLGRWAAVGTALAASRHVLPTSSKPEIDRSAEARHAGNAPDHRPEKNPSLPTLTVLVLGRQPVDDLAAIDVSAFEAAHIRAETGAKMKQVSAHVWRAHFLKFGSLDLG